MLGIAFGIICLVGARWVGYTRERAVNAERRLQENNDWIEKIYMSRSGWDVGSGQFDLLSLDQGKTWYQKVKQTDGTVTLIEATKLGRQQMALEKLANYVREHGPVDSSRAELIPMIEEAGLTIHKSTDASPSPKTP